MNIWLFPLANLPVAAVFMPSVGKNSQKNFLLLTKLSREQEMWLKWSCLIHNRTCSHCPLYKQGTPAVGLEAKPEAVLECGAYL